MTTGSELSSTMRLDRVPRRGTGVAIPSLRHVMDMTIGVRYSEVYTDPKAEVQIREGQLPHWFQPALW